MHAKQKRANVSNTLAVAVIVLFPELLLNCSWASSPWNLGAFQVWNHWIFNCRGLTMCVDASTLEMNPTGVGEKAPLPNFGALPDRFETKHYISGLLYWCVWTASLILTGFKLGELIAIWISVWIQYLWLKISSRKYRHFWEMSYQGMRIGNCQL